MRAASEWARVIMPGLDFLEGETPQLDTPAIEAPAEAIAAEPTPEAKPEGPVRGPDGKFVAKTPVEAPQEPAQAQTPEPAPAAPQPAPEPQHAPLSALLDEREKRQAAERRAQELEEQNRRLQPRAEPQSAPDPYEDPDGFAAFQQQQMDQRIYATNLQWSRRIAEVQHTPEVVAQAHEWGLKRCDSDPFFNQKVQTSPDPYGFVISEWKREQLLSEIQPDELAEYRAWKASQGQAAPASPPAPPAPQPAAVRPPVSLANAPSAGGAAHVPSGPGQAYDALPI